MLVPLDVPLEVPLDVPSLVPNEVEPIEVPTEVSGVDSSVEPSVVCGSDVSGVEISVEPSVVCGSEVSGVDSSVVSPVDSGSEVCGLEYGSLVPVDKEGVDGGELSLDTKFYLMQKVFMHTSSYDTLIADYLKKQRNDVSFPDTLTMTFEKVQDMRYGENPHQAAAFYREIGKKKGSITDALQLNGKELSFNNINDTNGALELLKEFTEPTVVACKHGNPCGVGSSEDIYTAWKKAFEADKTSIFGGIVVVNREVTAAMAEEMRSIFLEVIVAPSYEKEALELLTIKKNIRVLKLPDIEVMQNENSYDIKKVNGGLIIQTIDSKLFSENKEDLKVVTDRAPSEREMEDLEFAWRVVKFTKSNGIALAKDKQSIGIGPGQVNRIWAARQSIEHAKELISETITEGAVLASDAYFPFDDCVEAAHQAGITAIIQPGGSKRDEDSIKKCNEYGMAMIFTGMRHFKH